MLVLKNTSVKSAIIEKRAVSNYIAIQYINYKQEKHDFIQIKTHLFE